MLKLNGKSILDINKVISDKGKTIKEIIGTKIILLNIVMRLILKKLLINIGILTKKEINDVINIFIK